MGRQYKKDTTQFLHIARGSIYELETLLTIAMDVNIVHGKTYAGLMLKLERTMKLLNGLIGYMGTAQLK